MEARELLKTVGNCNDLIVKKLFLHTKNIKQVELLLNNAEDMFDDFAEELQEE